MVLCVSCVCVCVIIGFVRMRRRVLISLDCVFSTEKSRVKSTGRSDRVTYIRIDTTCPRTLVDFWP